MVIRATRIKGMVPGNHRRSMLALNICSVPSGLTFSTTPRMLGQPSVTFAPQPTVSAPFMSLLRPKYGTRVTTRMRPQRM